MGQKVNPVGFRVGVNHAWGSRWFAPKKTFGAASSGRTPLQWHRRRAGGGAEPRAVGQ